MLLTNHTTGGGRGTSSGSRPPAPLSSSSSDDDDTVSTVSRKRAREGDDGRIGEVLQRSKGLSDSFVRVEKSMTEMKNMISQQAATMGVLATRIKTLEEEMARHRQGNTDLEAAARAARINMTPEITLKVTQAMHQEIYPKLRDMQEWIRDWQTKFSLPTTVLPGQVDCDKLTKTMRFFRNRFVRIVRMTGFRLALKSVRRDAEEAGWGDGDLTGFPTVAVGDREFLKKHNQSLINFLSIVDELGVEVGPDMAVGAQQKSLLALTLAETRELVESLDSQGMAPVYTSKLREIYAKDATRRMRMFTRAVLTHLFDQNGLVGSQTFSQSYALRSFSESDAMGDDSDEEEED